MDGSITYTTNKENKTDCIYEHLKKSLNEKMVLESCDAFLVDAKSRGFF